MMATILAALNLNRHTPQRVDFLGTPSGIFQRSTVSMRVMGLDDRRLTAGGGSELHDRVVLRGPTGHNSWIALSERPHRIRMHITRALAQDATTSTAPWRPVQFGFGRGHRVRPAGLVCLRRGPRYGGLRGPASEGDGRGRIPGHVHVCPTSTTVFRAVQAPVGGGGRCADARGVLQLADTVRPDRSTSSRVTLDGQAEFACPTIRNFWCLRRPSWRSCPIWRLVKAPPAARPAGPGPPRPRRARRAAYRSGKMWLVDDRSGSVSASQRAPARPGLAVGDAGGDAPRRASTLIVDAVPTAPRLSWSSVAPGSRSSPSMGAAD